MFKLIKVLKKFSLRVQFVQKLNKLLQFASFFFSLGSIFLCWLDYYWWSSVLNTSFSYVSERINMIYCCHYAVWNLNGLHFYPPAVTNENARCWEQSGWRKNVLSKFIYTYVLYCNFWSYRISCADADGLECLSLAGVVTELEAEKNYLEARLKALEHKLSSVQVLSVLAG